MKSTIVDKTGREIKEGDIIEIMLMGMFQGQVRQIVTSPILLTSRDAIPPHVIIDVGTTPLIDANGMVQAVYLIKKAEELEPQGLGVVGADGKKPS